MKQLTDTAIVTNEVRASYANVFEPKSINGSAPKFSISLLIDKNDTETINAINACIEKAKENGVKGSANWGGKLPAALKTPLRDGDTEHPDDETYAGKYFINAISTSAPGVVKRGGDGKAVQIGPDEFYSGCYCLASINFYPYPGKNASTPAKGIACGLNNLMKTNDGEKLAGGRSAAEDFGLDEEGNEFM
jgi:hypothetical protein